MHVDIPFKHSFPYGLSKISTIVPCVIQQDLKTFLEGVFFPLQVRGKQI